MTGATKSRWPMRRLARCEKYDDLSDVGDTVGAYAKEILRLEVDNNSNDMNEYNGFIH